MTFKQRMVTSAVVIVVMLVVGLAGVWYIMEHASRSTREARAGMLGSGLGTLVCLVLAGIWLPYAYQIGAQKRAAQERKRKSKTAKRRR